MSTRQLRHRLLIVLVGLLGAHSATAWQYPELPRSLSERERVEAAFESSDLVVLARAISVRPDSSHGTARPGVLVEIEPVEWIKGGIDGDRLDVFLQTTESPNVWRYRGLVGKQESAGVFVSASSRMDGPSSIPGIPNSRSGQCRFCNSTGKPRATACTRSRMP
jgi:hypothetical protein